MTTALEQPELYGSQQPDKQFLDVLQRGLGKDTALEDLISKLLSHYSHHQLSTPCAFSQFLSDLTKELAQCSLMAVNYQIIDVFDFYASIEQLATLLTKLPQGKVFTKRKLLFYLWIPVIIICSFEDTSPLLLIWRQTSSLNMPMNLSGGSPADFTVEIFGI